LVQRQQLKQQQHNVDGSFGRQWMVAVALVAGLEMALVEQWQLCVRQQSAKKRQRL
jgi:hypothetical protein